MNMKNNCDAPRYENGLIQMIRMGKPIRHKLVKLLADLIRTLVSMVVNNSPFAALMGETVYPRFLGGFDQILLTHL